jgi:rare lipoprotein A
MRQLIAFFALLALAGCGSAPTRSGGYYQDDGPGASAPDVAGIPDAVPRNEPPSRYGNRPYTVEGRGYTPMASADGYRERGIASWYGKKFHGRRTSSGETYDMYAMTAAHKTLPLPAYVRVRNLDNGRSVIVRVNDRGPFLHNRLIDLSYAAAAKLGIVGTGTGVVEVEAVGPGAVSATVLAGPTAAQTRPLPSAPQPAVELIPGAHAAPAAGAVAGGPPRLFVQAGAFREWDNASALRTRLERAAFRPIFIQSVMGSNRNPDRDIPVPGSSPSSGSRGPRAGDGAPADSALTDAQARIYRVRIGPIASVAEGDRLAANLAQHGVADALIVVE